MQALVNICCERRYRKRRVDSKANRNSPCHRLSVQPILEPIALPQVAQGFDDVLCRGRERTRQGAATGVRMTAAAKTLRQLRNVNRAFTAQTKANTPVGQLPQQHSHFDSRDGNGVVHYALAILFSRLAAQHVGVRHPQPGNAAFAV